LTTKLCAAPTTVPCACSDVPPYCSEPRPGGPSGQAGQTWRLPVRYRVVIIAVQALLPGAAASLFWVPVTGDWLMPAPVTWLLLAGAAAAWLTLAHRAWQESATLAADTLVARNVFRTRRVPLADLTGLRFRGQLRLTITFAGPAASGRGHSGGRRMAVAAVTLGAAYWTGRRTAGDEAADAIAVAAGLPPLPLRKELVSRRQARSDFLVAMALLAAAVALGAASRGSGGLVSGAGRWLSRGLGMGAAALLFPVVLVTLDRLFGRWRKPSFPPDAGSGAAQSAPR